MSRKGADARAGGEASGVPPHWTGGAAPSACACFGVFFSHHPNHCGICGSRRGRDDSATEHSTSMCKRLLMSVEAIDEHVHIGHPKPFKPHQIKDLPQDEQQLWEDARIKEYNTLVENGTFIDEKPIDELDRVIPLGETLRYKRDGPGRAGVGTQAEEIPQVHQRTRDGLTARQVTLRVNGEDRNPSRYL
eukprot:scaffold17307_cov119-Isochrysis_galbana.AAC.1